MHRCLYFHVRRARRNRRHSYWRLWQVARRGCRNFRNRRRYNWRSCRLCHWRRNARLFRRALGKSHSPESRYRFREFQLYVAADIAVVLRLQNLANNFLLRFFVGEKEQLPGRHGGRQPNHRAVAEHQHGLRRLGKGSRLSLPSTVRAPFTVTGTSNATGCAFPAVVPVGEWAFDVTASRSLAVGGIAHSLAKLKFCNPKRRRTRTWIYERFAGIQA